MKKILKYLLLSTVLNNAYSSSIIIYGPETNEDCQTYAHKLIKKYTGLTASVFLEKPEKVDDPKYAPLFEASPMAETDFIQKKLNARYPSNQLTFNIVPTTVWDIAVISTYLNSQMTPDDLFEYFKNSNWSLPLDVRIGISNYIASSFKDLSKTESDDIGICRAFIIGALEILENEQLRSEWALWTKPLLGELQKLKQGKSFILTRCCEEELKALNANTLHLIRATAGYTPKSKNSYTRNNYTTLSRSNSSSKKIDPIHYNKNNDKSTTTLLDDIIPDDWSVDFAKILTEQRVNGERHDPTSYSLLSTKNLSFASSLLGGYFFDGPTKNQSACTYVYTFNPKMFTYSFQLNKKWFYSHGNRMFHFCESVLTTDAIIGRGEGFHPRVRSLHRTEGTNVLVPQENQKIFYSTTYPKFFPEDKKAWQALSDRISSDDIVHRESRVMAHYIIDFLAVMQTAQILSLPNQKVIQEHNPEAQKIIDNYRDFKKKFVENLR